jgi:hypothetical protein
VRWRQRYTVAVMLALFISSRLATRLIGVRFDGSPLYVYWQFADTELLRKDLVRTLWYWHATPPGFNAFLGAVLHLPQSWEAPTFELAFLVCGVVIMIVMYTLAAEFGVPRWAAVGVALAFALSPAAIVYENLLFYPYVVAALLCVTFVALRRYIATSSLGSGALLFLASATLVLTRGWYHLLWFLGIVLVVLLARPATRRRTLVLASVPLLLTTGLYVKNWVLFDTFTSSSWGGMYLGEIVRTAEAAPGRLSGQLAIPPFRGPEVYGANELKPTGVAVLDEQRKRRGGVNYNHIVYVDTSERYLRADLDYIHRHPARYASAALRSFRLLSLPATGAQGGLSNNVAELDSYERLYNRVIGWQPRQYSYEESNERRRLRLPPDVLHVSWSIVFAYTLSLAVLPAIAWRARRRPSQDADDAWVLAVMSGTVGFALMGNFFEIGENARFRFETDPIAWVLAAVAIVTLVRRVTHRQVDFGTYGKTAFVTHND